MIINTFVRANLIDLSTFLPDLPLVSGQNSYAPHLLHRLAELSHENRETPEDLRVGSRRRVGEQGRVRLEEALIATQCDEVVAVEGERAPRVHLNSRGGRVVGWVLTLLLQFLRVVRVERGVGVTLPGEVEEPSRDHDAASRPDGVGT